MNSSNPSNASSSTIDLRSQLGPPQDQGERNTCAAFALTAAHELHLTSSDSNCDLSKEWLHWAFRQHDPGDPDDGVLPDAFDPALRYIGQPEESQWPYTKSLLGDKYNYQPPHTNNSLPSTHKAGLMCCDYSEERIHAELMDGRPVLICLMIDDQFPYTGTDTLMGGNRGTSGHAMLIVGWTGSAWILRNSWGTEWGDNGYCYVSSEWLYQNLIGSDIWSIDQ